MDYTRYFNLSLKPFSSVPDERFFYNSPQHSKALYKLLYAAENMKGLALLVGDIGAGKTTISRRLLDILSTRGGFEISLMVVIHTEITPLWFLRKIAHQFGVSANVQDRVQLIGLLYKRLVEMRERGAKSVVMVDEANMLQKREIMEEIRGLLNMVVGGEHLITFILFGLPETEEYLKLDPPLYQRISIKCHLGPLDEESTKAYILHRLKVAGRTEPLFTPECFPIIHKASGGKPRLVNIICDNALLDAFLLKKPIVDRAILLEAIEDLGLKEGEEK